MDPCWYISELMCLASYITSCSCCLTSFSWYSSVLRHSSANSGFWTIDIVLVAHHHINLFSSFPFLIQQYFTRFLQYCTHFWTPYITSFHIQRVIGSLTWELLRFMILLKILYCLGDRMTIFYWHDLGYHLVIFPKSCINRSRT